MIGYKINFSNHQDIRNHFERCDDEFIKDLSSRVILSEYIDKILAKAMRYEAWLNQELVGLLAVYSNSDFDFITNISVVEDHTGQGIASKLIEQAIKDKKEMRLEVANNNHAAMALYAKLGFLMYDKNEKSNFLKLKK